MAKKFKLKSRASSEATKKANSKKGGKTFKFKKEKTRLLILPPVEDDAAIFETVFTHTLWGSKGPIASCASPFMHDEEDKIHSMGWEVREKYKNSKDDKIKGFFRNLLVDEKNCVNVLDLDDLESGPQVFMMPKTISDVVMAEFADVEDDDYTEIADLDEGRALQVTTNGETGKKIRYSVVKFLRKPVNLREDGKIDEDAEAELIESMPNLKKLQLKFNEDEFESFLKKVIKEGEKLGIDFDDLEVDEDDEEESDDEYESSESDDDDFDEEDLDDDDDFEDDEDEEEEEKPKKKKSKNDSKEKSKKKSSRRR